MRKLSKFTTDTFVSRELRCAVVLEEYLQEINDPIATRYAIKIMRRFNNFSKDITLIKNKNFYGGYLIKTFEKQIMDREDVPLFARTLLVNVIKTKYKKMLV